MRTASCRILAVDDDPGAIKIVRRILEGMGHRVAAASSRAEASVLLRGEPFDALLTDVNMESCDAGVRLAAEARALRPGLPVILMTGGLDAEAERPAPRDGAYDYLPKPFRLDDLRAAVERALSPRESSLEGKLAILSHELLTPLCSAQLAARQLEGEACSAEGALARGILSRNLARLEGTLADILLHARLAGGKLFSSFGVVDLSSVVREEVRAQSREAAALGLEVEVSVPEPGRPVRGDRELLTLAVRHLLRNALRFNRPGGRVRIGLGSERETAVLTVADDGEGIPASAQDRIFDPYYQAADFLTRRVGGLGLGLAIVRRIVEGHGGEVGVTSRPGEGSVFSVRLPLW